MVESLIYQSRFGRAGEHFPLCQRITALCQRPFVRIAGKVNGNTSLAADTGRGGGTMVAGSM
jgi:hypothetical protein